jgi:hypothetical protein
MISVRSPNCHCSQSVSFSRVTLRMNSGPVLKGRRDQPAPGLRMAGLNFAGCLSRWSACALNAFQGCERGIADVFQAFRSLLLHAHEQSMETEACGAQKPSSRCKKS